MSTTHALIAESIAKAYTTGKIATRVLEDLSLALEERELALVLGPSGSGKSTLLAILSGLLRPDRGRIVALGEDLWKLSRTELERFRLQHTGFVFQGFNLFPALTAVEQVMLPLGYLGLDVYEEEANLFFEDRSDLPLQDDVLARLLTFPNVIVTAHQAFLTREALAAIARTTLDNISAWAAGRPCNQVDA